MGLPPAMQQPFVRESYRLAHRVPLFDGIPELLAELRSRGLRLAVARARAASGPGRCWTCWASCTTSTT